MADNTHTVSSGGKPTSLIRTIKSDVRKLLRYWWIFLLAGLIAGGIGIVYSIYAKPKFQSRATFALDDGDANRIGNILNLASQFGLNINSGKSLFAGDNILEIIKSRRIIEEVLLTTDTFNHKPFTYLQYYIDKSGDNTDTITFPPGQDRKNFSHEQDSLLNRYYKKFHKTLIIADRPDKKLSIYEIKVTTPDEVLSKKITDKLLDATNLFYTEIRTKKSLQTLEILEERAGTMKQNLNKSFSERAGVQDANISPVFESASVPVLKQQSNIQVYGAAYAELFKNLELARFQYLNEIPIMQVIDAPTYPMERIKMGKLKAAILFAFLAEMLVLLILGVKHLLKD